MYRDKTPLLFLLAATLFFTVFFSAFASEPVPPDTLQRGIPAATAQLPALVCAGGGYDCHFSSPVLYDLTGNGRPEIIVATNNGVLLAFRYDGSLLHRLWQIDLAAATGLPMGSQEIRSSPAVGDLNGDGEPEIVVALGKMPLIGRCAHAAVLVVDRFGQWPQWQMRLPHDGCEAGFFSTPALGDLTGDGKLEIVIGGLDKRLYAWRQDGSLLPGFPIDSWLAGRFPTWLDLRGKLAAPVWSSPALVDLTGDGYLDIVIGADEGNFDSFSGGNSGGWYCPYALPSDWYQGYCGGALYAVNRFGSVLSGFPRYTHETFQSSPAIMDSNGDGIPDIFIGTGSFYHLNSPDAPTNGFRLYGRDRIGRSLPGWTHAPLSPGDLPDGLVTGGSMPASPALGDITGDGRTNVIVPGMDGRLYAWHPDGTPVAGFPMTPLTQTGTATPQNVGKSVVLADYTGDGRMEIFLTQSWSVTIVNGNGVQLTASSHPSHQPLYLTGGSLLNNPAIGDLDGDGRLELVVFNSTLYVWELPESAGTEAAWPVFRQNPARTGSLFRGSPPPVQQDARLWLPIIRR
jgi:hypothetical protein